MKSIIGYKGKTAPDLNKVAAVLKQHPAKVLYSTLMPKAARIEMDAATPQQLKHELNKGWHIVPGKTHAVPDTRKALKKS
jgi:hypothetical protein